MFSLSWLRNYTFSPKFVYSIWNKEPGEKSLPVETHQTDGTFFVKVSNRGSIGYALGFFFLNWVTPEDNVYSIKSTDYEGITIELKSQPNVNFSFTSTGIDGFLKEEDGKIRFTFLTTDVSRAKRYSDYFISPATEMSIFDLKISPEGEIKRDGTTFSGSIEYCSGFILYDIVKVRVNENFEAIFNLFNQEYFKDFEDILKNQTSYYRFRIEDTYLKFHWFDPFYDNIHNLFFVSFSLGNFLSEYEYSPGGKLFSDFYPFIKNWFGFFIIKPEIINSDQNFEEPNKYAVGILNCLPSIFVDEGLLIYSVDRNKVYLLKKELFENLDQFVSSVKQKMGSEFRSDLKGHPQYSLRFERTGLTVPLLDGSFILPIEYFEEYLDDSYSVEVIPLVSDFPFMSTTNCQFSCDLEEDKKLISRLGDLVIFDKKNKEVKPFQFFFNENVLDKFSSVYRVGKINDKRYYIVCAGENSTVVLEFEPSKVKPQKRKDVSVKKIKDLIAAPICHCETIVDMYYHDPSKKLYVLHNDGLVEVFDTSQSMLAKVSEKDYPIFWHEAASTNPPKKKFVKLAVDEPIFHTFNHTDFESTINEIKDILLGDGKVRSVRSFENTLTHIDNLFLKGPDLYSFDTLELEIGKPYDIAVYYKLSQFQVYFLDHQVFKYDENNELKWSELNLDFSNLISYLKDSYTLEFDYPYFFQFRSGQLEEAIYGIAQKYIFFEDISRPSKLKYIGKLTEFYELPSAGLPFPLSHITYKMSVNGRRIMLPLIVPDKIWQNKLMTSNLVALMRTNMEWFTIPVVYYFFSYDNLFPPGKNFSLDYSIKRNFVLDNTVIDVEVTKDFAAAVSRNKVYVFYSNLENEDLKLMKVIDDQNFGKIFSLSKNGDKIFFVSENGIWEIELQEK